MNKFITTFLVFASIVLLPIIIEITILPLDFFTYRVTESLVIYDSKDYFYGFYYPNKKINTIEYGDAAHHTSYSIPKEVTWITDSLGFRNTIFTRNPDIIFVGDSQTSGCSLDQDEMISELFRTKTKFSTYNIARDQNMGMYRRLREGGVMGKPKIIIFQTVERDIPMQPLSKEVKLPAYARFIEKFNLTELMITYDRIKKGNMKNYFSARLSNFTGYGINSPIKKEFLYVPQLMGPLIEKNIEPAISIIKKYKEFCEAEGITFIIVPIPNKETIFYDYVPKFDEQPKQMQRLAERLDEEKILNINLFKIFNEKKKEGEIMYHLDDAHWNARGVELTVDALIDLINKTTSKN